jgi:ribosomal protein S18 acetylase RimI-like enzyme
MTLTPLIREITDADIDAVVALWHAAGVAKPWNDPLRDIAFARRDAHSTVLVAEIEGRIVASVMVGEDGHRGWVYYVAADPAMQGGGLGRAMMAAAEAWLVGRGVWKLQLLVRGDNDKVKRFYEHLGYTDTKSSCFQKVIAP